MDLYLTETAGLPMTHNIALFTHGEGGQRNDNNCTTGSKRSTGARTAKTHGDCLAMMRCG